MRKSLFAKSNVASKPLGEGLDTIIARLAVLCSIINGHSWCLPHCLLGYVEVWGTAEVTIAEESKQRGFIVPSS
jgi:hypothetical protein